MEYVVLVFTNREYDAMSEAIETLKALSDGFDDDNLKKETTEGIEAFEKATQRGSDFIKRKIITC